MMVRMTLPFAAAVLLSGLLFSNATFAADRAPDLSVKTQAIDAGVTLDADIRTDTALTENLLAEARKWLEKNSRDAEKERRASPVSFRNGPWSFEREYSAASVVADRYVSVLRTDYVYTGGAHPNALIQTILWDRTAGKRISIRPFFKDTADNGATLKTLRKAILAALRVEKKARGVEEPKNTDWYDGVKPTLLGLGPVTLAPSTAAGKSAGLVFHYEPYAVGPYAEGSYEAFVPWRTFAADLTPEGVTVFAGERPPSADKTDR